MGGMMVTQTATPAKLRKAFGPGVLKQLEAYAADVESLKAQIAMLYEHQGQMAANQINLHERLQALEGAKPLVTL